MTWTNFKPSTDYIEILPYVGHEGRPGEWQAKLESDELAYFSQAEGCKPVPGSLLDYSHGDIACGIYFLRVEDKSAEDETKLSRRNLRLSFFNCTDSNACDNYDR